MKKKPIFTLGIYRFQHAFDVFDISLVKMLGYFMILNMLLFLPLTINIISLDEIDYGFFGMDFHEEVPMFINEGLPEDCFIVNNILDCGQDTIYYYQVQNNDTMWNIYINVPDNLEDIYNEDHSIVFFRNGFMMYFDNGNRFVLDYDYFNQTSFEELNNLEDQEAYDYLIDKLFLTLKDVFLLPIILFIIFALTITNFILLFSISLISMLFKFNQSNYPSFKNIFKLMILASTIPTMINIVLGFSGLIAFTTIVYNILTPIIAFFMYRASRQYQEIID